MADTVGIRLVNGSSRCSGRVEVFHSGQWGTICDDNWSIEDARVICQQLGCGAASSAPGRARFGRGTGNIWLDEVQCTGTESAIGQCPARPWGENDCNHGEDAGVVCSETDPAEVRLVNGQSRCSGRIELLRNRQWGTICDDNWGIEDARVVCRQLGCGTAIAALQNAQFGRGMGPIWLDEVQCRGTETNLGQCTAKPWAEHDCHHGEDAGVMCSDAADSSLVEIILVNGTSRCNGRIELFYDGQWGTVCDDSWGIEEAKVICFQLGCGNARSAPGRSQFGRGTGRIWLNEVQCVGTESALSQCLAKPWGQHNCNHGEDAGVECSDTVTRSDTADSEPVKIKLVNGSSHCSGRVELFYHGQWGTICDDNWGIEEAIVICQQLGCGPARSAPGGARFGRGSGRIWLDEVLCKGKESALSKCQARPWGENNCHHGQDAGVVCSDLRLVDGSTPCSGRVEVLHDQQWGTVCDNSWDLPDAHVVCREVGCGNAITAVGAARFGQGSGNIWLDRVACVGKEAALHECPKSPWGQHSCNHGKVASVECSVNGLHRCSGRVEIFHQQHYGTVCDDNWDLKEATVVCRYLDCGTPIYDPHEAHFGQGTGPIWMDDVECTGEEASLSACKSKLWGIHNCNHKEDAGVICSENLRLVNGSNRCSGRVEIRPNQSQEWGTVCDHTWDLNDATVVCKQLGCGVATSAPGGAQFGHGSGSIWLDDVDCQGIETAITECRANTQGNNNCHHGQDAGVVCSGVIVDTDSGPGVIRLVNGPSSCSGRVELLRHGQWGTICDDSWGTEEAIVVCQQLGCGTARSAPGRAQFGSGTGRIWLDDVGCTGSESSLSQCKARPWGENDCGHGEDAGVVCSDHSEVRLINGSHRCSGRVEVLHFNHYGTVCDDSWDLRDATVVCRSLDCGTAIAAPQKAHFGQGPNLIWLDDMECTGKETSLSVCKAAAWGSHNCNHGEDAGVVCSENLRLVNGSDRCSGRVEFRPYHSHEWRTVCDRTWDLNDASVVCRQLGCGAAASAPGGAQFGHGSGSIWLDYIGCQGTEDAIQECRAHWEFNDCHHGQDAGVICTDTAEIRLVNGSNCCNGRVEILHNGQWGTICDDNWDIEDARVICQQLGCGVARLAPGGAEFGSGSGQIWLDEVSCIGNESFLSQCQARPWGENNCNHGEDAAVVCSAPLEDLIVPSTEEEWIQLTSEFSTTAAVEDMSVSSTRHVAAMPTTLEPTVQESTTHHLNLQNMLIKEGTCTLTAPFLRTISFHNTIGDMFAFDQNGDFVVGFDTIDWVFPPKPILSQSETCEKHREEEIKGDVPTQQKEQRKIGISDHASVLHEYYQPGDLVIGAIVSQFFSIADLLSFTEYPKTNPTDKPIAIPKHYQHVLALVFAVKEIQKNPNKLSNMTLGFHIYDSYFDARMTYENTLKFVSTCFLVPVIGDTTRSPSIYQMVPKEVLQYNGIVQLLLHFQWIWVGIIAMEDDKGIHFMQTLTSMFLLSGICTAFTERIPVTSTVFDLWYLMKHTENMTPLLNMTNVIVINAHIHTVICFHRINTSCKYRISISLVNLIYLLHPCPIETLWETQDLMSNWKIVPVLQCSSSRKGDVKYDFSQERDMNDCSKCPEDHVIPKNYQHVLALVFAVKEIQKNPSILPNMTIGFHIYDSYFNARMTYQNTLELLSTWHQPVPNYSCGIQKNLVAVIGGLDSETSIHIANIMDTYKIPQITFGFLIPLIGGKTRFSSIYQMFPKEIYQYIGIAQLLLYFQWTWVGIIATEDDKGIHFMQTLMPVLSENGICVAFTEKIPEMSAVYDLQNLMEHTGNMKYFLNMVNVTVVNAHTQTLSAFMALIDLARIMYAEEIATSKVWIMTSEWAFSSHTFNDGLDTEVFYGALSFAVHSSEVFGFQNFLQNLNPLYPEGDGFLGIFWEQTFKCSLPNSNTDEGDMKRCAGEGKLETLPGTFFEMSMTGQSYSIYNAAHAIAHALHTMWSSRPKRRSITNGKRCDALQQQGWKIHSFLRSTSFNNSAGEEILLNSHGELVAGFDIINWIIFSNQSISRIKIGRMDPEAAPGKEVTLENEIISWHKDFNQVLYHYAICKQKKM
ncbi:hypothetical protein JD844_001708 [Phrynosoma platyrhinos]|uniref:SRCR domain-containing protein n=1 Tax=Phrynosoma platyrhinos TaxID=52577 RepID=A0ABQ7TA73_PHRPL|nr:hypothetical protein JD844_001708 [Phrynosoma platyrhinos]